MDEFEKLVVATITKIRETSKRPDVDSIYKHIKSHNATNYCKADVESIIQTLLAKKQIENRLTNKGLDSFFIISSSQDLEEKNCNQNAENLNQFSPSKDDTQNISVETPTHKNIETPAFSKHGIEDITTRLVANKAFFMNEIYELKKEIYVLKNKFGDWENLNPNFDDKNIIKNLELQISHLQQENSFIKIELQQKQNTIDNLLKYNNNQLTKDSVTKEINQNKVILQKHQGNPGIDSSKKHVDSGKPNNDRKSIQSSNNITSKKKLTIVGDSMIKYIRREDISSKQCNAKVVSHPGATTEDMLDYIKPLVRKKPDYLFIHTGTNDLTNGVNTMKKVKKLTKIIRELDSEEEIKLGFSSIIGRADRDLADQISEVNGKLERYCNSKGFIFIDNKHIGESCLNNSKLHLNKNGTSILSRNFKKSLHHG